MLEIYTTVFTCEMTLWLGFALKYSHKNVNKIKVGGQMR